VAETLCESTCLPVTEAAELWSKSILCEVLEDLLTGSRELGVRRTPIGGIMGKRQAFILAVFELCNTTHGAKSASIILILLSHFELHC